MRLGKIWLVLIIIFFIAFYWANGNNVTPVSITKPAISFDNATLFHRLYRVIALKEEVHSKVSKLNYTQMKDIPLSLQQSIIAVEDNRFYRHYGFDIEGIIRATLVNIQSGELQEGGSTITQQLVKNLFLTHERTWVRKIEEVVLAIDMEARYSKEEILELYLNTIYFGSGATGIADAADIYFGKTPAQLNLAESSLLAGLPNAPSLYSPYVDYSAAKQRQAIVLSVLVKYGYIGPTAAEEAKTAHLHFAK
ncbi:MAG: Peptidoglycan glycosyltransferase [Firmicutes bacterium]|nr:Peptidoglycan glycosyltransferase [Bacillota bacterium]